MRTYWKLNYHNFSQEFVLIYFKQLLFRTLQQLQLLLPSKLLNSLGFLMWQCEFSSVLWWLISLIRNHEIELSLKLNLKFNLNLKMNLNLNLKLNLNLSLKLNLKLSLKLILKSKLNLELDLNLNLNFTLSLSLRLNIESEIETEFEFDFKVNPQSVHRKYHSIFQLNWNRKLSFLIFPFLIWK